MKNFYAYIVKNKEGKILDPTFIIGDPKHINLLEKEELVTRDIYEFIKLTQKTIDDAEETIIWYVHSCEVHKVTPEKLHVEKIQMTIICQEV